MKALENIERIQFNNETLLQLLPLYECKGKEFYYKDLFQRDSLAFEKKTIEMDVIALAKILNLDVSESRIKQWGKKALTPKNKDEELLKNLKTSLVRLQELMDNFELYPNEVYDLAKIIAKGITTPSYQTYNVQGTGILAKSKSKFDDLEALIKLFNQLKNSKKYELIQLISNFYIDFYNMEIFVSQNEYVGLILLYTLIATNFRVFKYVSFFTYFLEKKEAIRTAEVQSTYYWNEGFSQTETLFRILLIILNSSYQEVERIAHEYEFEKTLNKSNNIENTISKLPSIFTKEDIRKQHPTISDTTIDRTLKRLRDEKKITPLGKGRTSRWQRVNEEDEVIRGMKQMTMFGE